MRLCVARANELLHFSVGEELILVDALLEDVELGVADPVLGEGEHRGSRIALPLGEGAHALYVVVRHQVDLEAEQPDVGRFVGVEHEGGAPLPDAHELILLQPVDRLAYHDPGDTEALGQLTLRRQG